MGFVDSHKPNSLWGESYSFSLFIQEEIEVERVIVANVTQLLRVRLEFEPRHPISGPRLLTT
jgi:hypothetical protein